MTDWERLYSEENLHLAWDRVLRSGHIENKDRIGLRVFGANLNANLAYLSSLLEEHLVSPDTAEKMYLPKRAGTARTHAVLTIRDRLVYQAIANVIALKSKDPFEAIVENHVFAHLLAEADSPFMLRYWAGPDGQYQRFKRRFRQQWGKGNHWAVEADISSFYDTIDHELLIKLLRNRWGIDEPVLELLGDCLRAWTAHEEVGNPFSRGIPQGYEASDYLATLFLLPTDEIMIQKGSYLRYVDDIRLLAPSRDGARRLLLELDVSLKGQALVLQPSKTGARRIDRIDEELKALGGKLSVLVRRARSGEDIDQELESLFFKSWHTLDKDPNAESQLVFALNRIGLSGPARNVALEMLPTLPWRSSHITSYLSQFDGDEAVVNVLLKEIHSHTVYASYLSDCLRTLAKVANIDAFRDISRSWVSNKTLRWYQRLAAVESLQYDLDSFAFLFLSYQSEPNYLVRQAALVAAAFTAQRSNQRAAVIRKGFEDPDSQVQATAVWLYLELEESGIETGDLPDQLGVHRLMVPEYSQGPQPQIEYIRGQLADRFDIEIPEKLDFQGILGDGYDQAARQLRRALRNHDTDPMIFVESIDNFNHVLAICLTEQLLGLSIPRDEYSNMIGAIRNTYEVVSVHFRRCHELRSNSSGPHPWASSLATWSQDITHKDKEEVISGLRLAYGELLPALAHE